jgi:hypothetical protein
MPAPAFICSAAASVHHSIVRAVAPWAVACELRRVPCSIMYNRRPIRRARHVVVSSIPVPWELSLSLHGPSERPNPVTAHK